MAFYARRKGKVGNFPPSSIANKAGGQQQQHEYDPDMMNMSTPPGSFDESNFSRIEINNGDLDDSFMEGPPQRPEPSLTFSKRNDHSKKTNVYSKSKSMGTTQKQHQHCRGRENQQQQQQWQQQFELEHRFARHLFASQSRRQTRPRPRPRPRRRSNPGLASPASSREGGEGGGQAQQHRWNPGFLSPASTRCSSNGRQGSEDSVLAMARRLEENCSLRSLEMSDDDDHDDEDDDDIENGQSEGGDDNHSHGGQDQEEYIHPNVNAPAVDPSVVDNSHGNEQTTREHHHSHRFSSAQVDPSPSPAAQRTTKRAAAGLGKKSPGAEPEGAKSKNIRGRHWKNMREGTARKSRSRSRGKQTEEMQRPCPEEQCLHSDQNDYLDARNGNHNNNVKRRARSRSRTRIDGKQKEEPDEQFSHSDNNNHLGGGRNHKNGKSNSDSNLAAGEGSSDHHGRYRRSRSVGKESKEEPRHHPFAEEQSSQYGQENGSNSNATPSRDTSDPGNFEQPAHSDQNNHLDSKGNHARDGNIAAAASWRSSSSDHGNASCNNNSYRVPPPPPPPPPRRQAQQQQQHHRHPPPPPPPPKQQQQPQRYQEKLSQTENGSEVYYKRSRSFHSEQGPEMYHRKHRQEGGQRSPFSKLAEGGEPEGRAEALRRRSFHSEQGNFRSDVPPDTSHRRNRNGNSSHSPFLRYDEGGQDSMHQEEEGGRWSSGDSIRSDLGSNMSNRKHRRGGQRSPFSRSEEEGQYPRSRSSETLENEDGQYRRKEDCNHSQGLHRRSSSNSSRGARSMNRHETSSRPGTPQSLNEVPCSRSRPHSRSSRPHSRSNSIGSSRSVRSTKSESGIKSYKGHADNHFASWNSLSHSSDDDGDLSSQYGSSSDDDDDNDGHIYNSDNESMYSSSSSSCSSSSSVAEDILSVAEAVQYLNEHNRVEQRLAGVASALKGKLRSKFLASQLP